MVEIVLGYFELVVLCSFAVYIKRNESKGGWYKILSNAFIWLVDYMH